MKRLSYHAMVVLLCFNFVNSLSQHTESIELSQKKDNFTLLHTGNNKYIVHSLGAEYYYIDNSDLPALPAKKISVLVPNGSELIDYQFSFKSEVIEDEILIDHSPVIMPTIPIKRNPEDEFIYKDIYPEKSIQFSTATIQRGYTQFNFTFIPFIYDGIRKELNFITELDLEVVYNINPKKISSIHPDEDIALSIKQNIANPKAIDRFYPLDVTSQNKKSGGNVDYLIITNEYLKNDFTPLLHWKIRKGLNVEIITLEEIEQKYDESSIQLKIKKCLFDYYNIGGLKWALLGGDQDIIPVQYCYSKITFEKSDFEDNIPTDLFYACFDHRFDWNSFYNEKIGEMFFDGHDITPDIFLTRIPVNTRQDVKAFVEKTLRYENHPAQNTYNDKMLFAGVKLWSSWEGKSDSHHRSDLIFDTYVNMKWKGEKLSFYDTGTDFLQGSDYQVTSGNLSDRMNEGFGYFHFTGHGNNQYWVMEAGKAFNVDDATNLTNKASGIVMTNACNVNAFDISEPSLSEALLRNPNGGCIAFFGSSRYGFGNPEPSNMLGASLKYNANFMKYLFSEDQSYSKSFGQIASSVKSGFSTNSSTNGVFNYLLYSINPMGDPELPLYVGKLKTFNNIRLYKMGNSLHVNTGGIENGKICITSLNLKDGYQEVAKNVSHHEFQDIPEEFQVTITAPDYIPYIYVSGALTGANANIRSMIKVYPNPANEYLRVNFNLSGGHLQIHDITGKLLKELIISHGSNHINISDLPDGLLILNFTSKNGKARFKIVKSQDTQK